MVIPSIYRSIGAKAMLTSCHNVADVWELTDVIVKIAHPVIQLRLVFSLSIILYIIPNG